MKSMDDVSKEQLVEFNEVTQMQLDEFGIQLAKACNARIAICMVDTGETVQVAVHSRAHPDEAASQMMAIQAMCMVAGASLTDVSGGELKLLIRMPDGTLEDACPPNTKAVTGRRPAGGFGE